jgi:hypothetical protein
MPERALGVYLLGLWEGGMRTQANAGCCCRPSSPMRFGLRIRHFHILRAAKGNNAYRSRSSIQLAVCKGHKTQVASRESAVGSGREDLRVTFALMLAAGARLRLVAFARVKQTSCDHLTGRSLRGLACDHCIRSRPTLNGRWRGQ